jgi:hypothetical protein
MLCRFRMTVDDDCLDEYKRMGQDIFGKPRIVSQRNIAIAKWPKYSAVHMEKAFKKVNKQRGLGPFASQEDAARLRFKTECSTYAMCVCPHSKSSAPIYDPPLMFLVPIRFATTKLLTKGKDASSKKLYLIRSDHRQPVEIPDDDKIVNLGKAEKMAIWQVDRAVTAAPMYFTEFRYSFSTEDPSEKFCFSDGSFGHTNNPTRLGIQETRILYGHDNLSVVISSGTARADAKPGKRGKLHRVKEGFESKRFLAQQPHPRCFWYSSLRLRNNGLASLGPLNLSIKTFGAQRSIKRYKPLLLSPKHGDASSHMPRGKMVFTWQGPLIFVSYSVCAFLAGLTILVCTPFIRQGAKWTVGHNVSTHT